MPNNRPHTRIRCSFTTVIYRGFDPFVKVNKWADARSIIKSWGDIQIKKKQEECKSWWNNYKNYLQDMIKNKVIQ